MTKKKQKFDMEKLFDPFETPGPKPIRKSFAEIKQEMIAAAQPKLFSVRTGADDCVEKGHIDANGIFKSDDIKGLLSYKCEHGQLLNLDGCDTCELLGEEAIEVTKLREEVTCLQGELERVKDERDKLQDECDALQNELYTYRGH